MKDAKFVPAITRTNSLLPCTALAGMVLLTGCARAPSFNILGSFFPAWLLCMVAGLLFATTVNWILVHYGWEKKVPWGIVVYPCLAAFFAFTVWLIFFD